MALAGGPVAGGGPCSLLGLARAPGHRSVDLEALERPNRFIAAGPFHVEMGREYRLEEAAPAHGEVGRHLGKLALHIR